MSEALQDVVDFLRSSGELPEPESGYNVSNYLETIYWDIPNWFVRLDLDHSARSFLLSILKFRTDFLVREFCDTPNAIALFLMNNGACDFIWLEAKLDVSILRARPHFFTESIDELQDFIDDFFGAFWRYEERVCH